ncbi:MAG: hypothetical protein M3Q91_17270 [Acidobacteriota bacterium]|nr:hypothetical protein [Acidobacteriota bacterium]
MSQAIEKFTPKEIIRTETALSRFPVHRLSKKGSIHISIKVAKPNGELKTQWNVSYNSEYGQPSPLAYKLDTLIIIRKIEEEGKPLPKLIRLGSLTEIAQQTGTGEKNTNAIKRALLQNAFAAIRAKFSYKTKGGNEAFAEIADTLRRHLHGRKAAERGKGRRRLHHAPRHLPRNPQQRDRPPPRL